MLLVSTENRTALAQWLKGQLGAEKMTFDVVFDSADEFFTIIYVSSELKPQINQDEVTDVYLIKRDTIEVMCELMAGVEGGLVTGVRSVPKILIMRVIGDCEQTLEKLQQDFGGRILNYLESIDSGNSGTTVIGLTQKPVNRSANLSDLHPRFLAIDGDYPVLRRKLAMKAFSYVNIGEQIVNWNRLEIRIYDLYSDYQHHYERLLEVLDALELGLVLGKFWSKDYPRFMMPVEVYSVIFFTYADPLEIKRILLGLEHLDGGVRLVDYDLFLKDKKIYWKQTVPKGSRMLRHEAARVARADLLLRLDKASRQRLFSLEAQLLEHRNDS